MGLVFYLTETCSFRFPTDCSLTMGVGRRFKKQGPPATLEELGINLKRKPNSEPSREPAKKRRKSDEHDSKKLVNLDRALRTDNVTDPKSTSSKTGENKKSKKKKQKLVNPDAQITVPPKFPSMPESNKQEEEEEEDKEEASEAEGIPLDEASLSGMEEDEMVEAELEDAVSEDSVFDSDPDEQPRRMFSDDEDESDAEAQLTAANIEGLSRKLDQEQAQVEAEAQQELEDAAFQTNIAKDEGVLDAVAAQGLAPDLAVLRTRMTETIRILGNFSKLADKSRSRTDYTEQLLSDVCTYYGYTRYLAEKLFAFHTCGGIRLLRGQRDTASSRAEDKHFAHQSSYPCPGIDKPRRGVGTCWQMVKSRTADLRVAGPIGCHARISCRSLHIAGRFFIPPGNGACASSRRACPRHGRCAWWKNHLHFRLDAQHRGGLRERRQPPACEGSDWQYSPPRMQERGCLQL